MNDPLLIFVRHVRYNCYISCILVENNLGPSSTEKRHAAIEVTKKGSCFLNYFRDVISLSLINTCQKI